MDIDSMTFDEIQSVEVLRPRTGDILIFRTPHRLSVSATHRLRQQLQERLRANGLEGVDALILEETSGVTLVRPATAGIEGV